MRIFLLTLLVALLMACGSQEAPTEAPSPTPTSTPMATPVTAQPTEAAAPLPTSTPASTATPASAPPPTSTAALTPAPDLAFIIGSALIRLNEQRQALGLGILHLVEEDDAGFSPAEEFVVGCNASADEYEELLREDIGGIALSLSEAGVECGLRVVTYRLAASEQPTGTPPSLEPTEGPEKPTAIPSPTPDPAQIMKAAFSRFNQGRQQAGLDALKQAVEGDDAFIPVQDLLVGCYASAEEYEELLRADLHAIGLSISNEGTECGLRVVTYHIVPLDQRMRVERSVWECFTDSRDLREASDISCGGRFTFLGRHVKWLPGQVSYTLVEGEALLEKFRSHIPWMEEKLKVKVSEASSAETAHILLHLGVQSPANCPERYGCSIWEEVEDRSFATIYISAPDEFFSQVLKHELLHALLPIGHLPEGDYLMSVRPPDPSQTHTLSPLEEKLLALYTHPYLRADMTMDQFRQYLVIQ